MKKTILFLFLIACVAAQAQQKQSLKDLLYSGKLKLDSNSVVRKDDDLSAKIDTATRKPEPEKPKPTETTTIAAVTPTETVPKTETAAATTTEAGTETTTPPATDEATSKPVPAKSNTKVLKEYTDAMLASFKTGVLTNKKIKKEDYFVIVDYELGETGAVTVTNVTASPENALLQSEVKTYLDNNPLQLQPVKGSDGVGRKVKRKHSFTVTKE